jgi:hypothetical protein
VNNETENLLQLTDAFWRLSKVAFRGIMTDVVFWTNANGYHRIAFVGNPEKVSKLFGMGLPDDQLPGMYPSAVDAVGRAIRSVMRVPIDSRDWSGGSSLSEFLDRLTGQVVWQWSEAHSAPIGEEGVRVGFIPEPGYPWPCEGGWYWSARKSKWLQSEKPGWLIQVEDRSHGDKMVWGVNPCLVFPSDETKTSAAPGYVCGELNGQPLMVTHSMQLISSGYGGHKQVDAAIAGVRDCGGLLFPSLAVGPIPATNFGPIVLVAHLELVTDSLQPYRGRSKRRPCWVYGTDAWTHSTGTLMREIAISLFSELHGEEDWIYGHHIDTLGIPPSTRGIEGEVWNDPLKTTKQLASSLKTRMRGWRRDMTLAEFDAKGDSAAGSDRYAYTEAKAREVVSLAEFPFIIAPLSKQSAVARFAVGTGYSGSVVYVDVPEIERHLEQDDPDRDYWLYRWSWIVADTIKGLRPVVKVLT